MKLQTGGSVGALTMWQIRVFTFNIEQFHLCLVFGKAQPITLQIKKFSFAFIQSSDYIYIILT